MDMVAISSAPRTVKDVFKDYSSRRAAIVRALTTEVDEFYRFCDPEKENLCLYGHPNGSWEVSLPVEDVPPELPEPALGINFARDGMNRKDWLSLVAVHSDSWLLAIAFFFAAQFNGNERTCLSSSCNDMSTHNPKIDVYICAVHISFGIQPQAMLPVFSALDIFFYLPSISSFLLDFLKAKIYGTLVGYV